MNRLIGPDQREQFEREGYFILTDVIPDEHLRILRESCDRLIELMHQDSGYLGFPHRPYVTCWAAVDDMTLENGTTYVLPFSRVGIRTLVEHVRDPVTGDKVGYFGDEPGVPAVVPAGSVVVFSSLTFHRSGANATDRMRRAYVTQYSSQPIRKPDDSGLMHLAVPFLRDGQRVAPPASRF